LIYHDFALHSVAKNRLKFQDQVIRYGEETGPLERDPWGTFRYVSVGGESSQDDDIFSSMKDLPIFSAAVKEHLPVWPVGRKFYEQGMYYAEQITELRKIGSTLLIIPSPSIFYYPIKTNNKSIKPPYSVAFHYGTLHAC